MSASLETFELVKRLLDQEKTPELLQYLAEHFISEKQYSELFEIRKFQIRNQLGLPLNLENQLHALRTEQQRDMEDRLLDACKEVGSLCFASGDISRGWMFLQPLIDRESVKQIIESVSVNDKNLDELIEVALYQWGAPEFGYRLLLENQGTCNGITFFDTQIAYQDSETRKNLTEILIDHLYHELISNINAVVAERNPGESENQSLIGLIDQHSWIFENCGHHIDVTHLASAVRIARFAETHASLNQAIELCTYGKKLDPQLQYESEPPFENLYSDHAHFFQAILGVDTETAIAHFKSKAQRWAGTEFEHDVRAVLIELFVRTDQSALALEICLHADSDGRFQEEDIESDFTSLISIAKTKVDFDRLMSHFEKSNSLIGFAIAGIHQANAD